MQPDDAQPELEPHQLHYQRPIDVADEVRTRPWEIVKASLALCIAIGFLLISGAFVVVSLAAETYPSDFWSFTTLFLLLGLAALKCAWDHFTRRNRSRRQRL